MNEIENLKFMLFNCEILSHNFLVGFKEYKTHDFTMVYDDYSKINHIVKEYVDQDFVFVGFDNNGYNNHVMSQLLSQKNPYEISQKIIKDNYTYEQLGWPKVPYVSIDVLDLLSKEDGNSLDVLKSDLGLSISKSDVDPQSILNENDIQKMIPYNKYDIFALEKIWEYVYRVQFKVKFDVIKYFNLDVKSHINKPLPMIMALGLNAKKPKTPFPERTWQTPENLIVDAETLYYLENEQYLQLDEKGKNIKRTFVLCDLEHIMGLGGLHAALKNFQAEWGLYVDLSGYYTFIQLLYKRLSRALGEEGYTKVWELESERARLTKENNPMAKSLKEGILSIWGAMLKKKHLLYDPYTATQLSLLGQAFVIDLLLKLEPYIILVQSNTDGLFLVPKDGLRDGADTKKITTIIDEWSKRTGFKVKTNTFENLWQKDVNNYVCIENGKKIIAKGGYVKSWNADKAEFWERNIGNTHKQGAIIDKALVNYMLYNVPLATTIMEETDLSMFQFTARVVKVDNVDGIYFKKTNTQNGEINYEKTIHETNRVFALKNEHDIITQIVKKNKGDGYPLIPNLPDNQFVYNGEMTDILGIEEINESLDRNWYVEKAQKRLNDYLGISERKKTNVQKQSLFNEINTQIINIKVNDLNEKIFLTDLLNGKTEWALEEGSIGDLLYSETPLFKGKILIVRDTHYLINYKNDEIKKFIENDNLLIDIDGQHLFFNVTVAHNTNEWRIT